MDAVGAKNVVLSIILLPALELKQYRPEAQASAPRRRAPTKMPSRICATCWALD
jgi:hypothetical protein